MFENDNVVHEMSHSRKEEKEWYSVLSVDGVKIKFKLDSGATCNVIPRELFFAVYLNVEFNVYAPFVQDFADVFNGLGMIATEHEIKLLPGHAPVVCAAARLPF